MFHNVTLTAQETYDMIRGAMVFPWFADKSYEGVREDNTAHSDWEILVTFMYDGISYPLNHHTVSKAVNAIIHGKADGSWVMREAIMHAVLNGIHTDDADYGRMSNLIAQVATYGHEVYSV